MIQNLLEFSELFGTNPESAIEHYLDACDYYAVNSKDFISKYGDIVDIANPEEGKKLALSMFSKRITQYGQQTNRSVKLGFSDDDKGNVVAITKHFNEINDLFDINFSVFDTSNPDIIGGKQTNI